MAKPSEHLSTAQLARGYDFVVATNQRIQARERRIVIEGSDDEKVFRYATSLLSTLSDEVKKNDNAELVRLADAMDLHLQGATRNTVAKQLGEIIQTKQDQRSFIGRVARLAAAIHEGRNYDWRGCNVPEEEDPKKQSVTGSNSPITRETVSIATPTIEEAIIHLLESGKVDKGQATGLLLLFDLRDTGELDSVLVDRIVAQIRLMIQGKIRAARGEYPLLREFVGDRLNAKPPVSIDGIVKLIVSKYIDPSQLIDLQNREQAVKKMCSGICQKSLAISLIQPQVRCLARLDYTSRTKYTKNYDKAVGDY